MSCKVCQLPECAQQRVEWGCDAPTKEPVLQVYGVDGEPVPLHRCPFAEMDPSALDVCQHASMLAAQIPGSWPVDGGTCAQSATFLKAVKLALGLHSRYARDRMERGGKGGS